MSRIEIINSKIGSSGSMELSTPPDGGSSPQTTLYMNTSGLVSIGKGTSGDINATLDLYGSGSMSGSCIVSNSF